MTNKSYAIVFASSKGGAGKTTAAIVFASELQRRKVPFSIIDADPNKHIYNWGKQAGLEKVYSTNEDNIFDDIESQKQKSRVVIVDLEGSKNLSLSNAVSAADFVVIPCNPSDLDGKEAMNVANFIKKQERILGRTIKHALLRTRTPAAIVTKTERYIVDDFKNFGSDVLENRLIEREAYKNVVSFGCFVHDLKAETKRQEVSINKAVNGGNKLAVEIIKKAQSTSTSKIKEEAHAN